MANGPALSSLTSGYIYMESEIRDSFSLLDVLYANQFEEETLDQNLLEEAEVNFYRGAPAEWLNFYFSEQAASTGRTPLIKRDGYKALMEKIQKRNTTVPGISEVKLFHQPGCGGTTLAMQVLWDLRKKFRCAVLTGSSPDITRVAKEVTSLFTAGHHNKHNTVLLLVNDEQMLERLLDCVMTKMAELNIVPSRPVAILLSCVRKDVVLPDDYTVLKNVLSQEEQQKFSEMKIELSRRYSERYEQFHGFNIMETNFCEQYIKQACTVFRTVKNAERPLKTQLAAFISLLNAYVPGSYLLESQCLNFLKRESSIDEDLSMEDRMMPFSDLIVTFRPDARSETRVRMAHPMIAQCCSQCMAEAGVSTSKTAKNFLTCFCSKDAPLFLHGFVKDMLTKRGMKRENAMARTNEDQELFSQLILDIKSQENEEQSVSVLKLASQRFQENPFFPQALARFYCIALKDYNQAEIWAKKAKQRDPKNSFVADTLGQVHKNHLNYLKHRNTTTTPVTILQLAKKATDAFKIGELLAEYEKNVDMKEDGICKVSHVFNTSGKFGFLKVWNLVFDLLVSENETWRQVLRKERSLRQSVMEGQILPLLGNEELNTFSPLIERLRDEVERKCTFLRKYLTYSKPEKKDDPPYLSIGIEECYRKYVSKSPSNLANTSAGAFTLFQREYTENELKEITEWGKKICLRRDSATDTNSAFGEIELQSPEDVTELHMLALLLNWPSDSEAIDCSPLIERMRSSYEHAYKAYFRSRCLQPLFFIGKGQGRDRIIPRKSLGETQGSNIWNNEKIFQDPTIQELLLEVEGEVRNNRVYATTGGRQIEVETNQQNSLWRRRQVCFYIGFNIRGPVAFCIRTKTTTNSMDGEQGTVLETAIHDSPSENSD